VSHVAPQLPRKSTFSSFLQQWTHLWKGLTPALLLCANPAIHYTVYDILKQKILPQLTTTTTISNRSIESKRQLSMSQAFFLGLAAKFLATIVTYPLIRAKVILMVSPSAKDVETDDRHSLWTCLIRSYQQGNLYKGCDWQLIHTLLKSALMMMVRERITDQTRRLVVGNKKTNK
jgi:hypothetical protein